MPKKPWRFTERAVSEPLPDGVVRMSIHEDGRTVVGCFVGSVRLKDGDEVEDGKIVKAPKVTDKK